MILDVKEFYNGKPLLEILINEKIKAFYKYDRDKTDIEDKYREINFFLTDKHLIKTVAHHEDISVYKWSLKNFIGSKKNFEIGLYNTKKSLEIISVEIYTNQDEKITIEKPKKTVINQEENFKNFVSYI